MSLHKMRTDNACRHGSLRLKADFHNVLDYQGPEKLRSPALVYSYAVIFILYALIYHNMENRNLQLWVSVWDIRVAEPQRWQGLNYGV